MQPNGNQTVALIRDGLQRLSQDEIAYLDKVVTKEVRDLFAKAFGPEMYQVLTPLVENDASADDPPLGEEALRKKMRDPRYWRDQDAAFIEEVSKGFERLYPDNGRG